MEYLKNFIDGAYHSPVSGQYLDNVNPATGEVYSQIPRSGADDLTMAVNAAERAFPI